MNVLKEFQGLIGRIRLLFCPVRPGTIQDLARIRINGVDMEVTRKIGTEVPYEVTVVVPRVEIRKRCSVKDGPCECEIILNSITIAHSPRPISEPGHSLPNEPKQIGMSKKNKGP
ncbi:MAG TPA: hypothetical protein VHR47_04645 [Bacillota bacterium]|nr:hypothetical protein [Bacillota bacterium]